MNIEKIKANLESISFYINSGEMPKELMLETVNRLLGESIKEVDNIKRENAKLKDVLFTLANNI